jgi:hypothetical protein
VEEILFAWICGEIVKEIVTEYRARKASDVETKILTKGGSLFTMAVLGDVAKLRNGNFCLKQLDQERITSNMGKERLRKYARYALTAYLSAVKDAAENRKEEFPTLIRSRDFYHLVRDRVRRQFQNHELAGEEWLRKALPKLI